ncbi:hypothetical protein LCGC14_1181120 [marine sediment metagenome]|uniref:Uncharacterized protein n=1 Tax=marine sediment metagenome TaxID=412755 RepID=A0A0F9LM57_9ZZZZ
MDAASKMKDLSWTCHVCGRERPDDKISVFSRPLVLAGRVCGQENIRYCNDSDDCAKKAQVFSFFR